MTSREAREAHCNISTIAEFAVQGRARAFDYVVLRMWSFAEDA